MPSSYPAGYDAFGNPIPSDALDSVAVPHATQHDDINNAMEAVQGTLGLDPQGTEATVADRLDALDVTDAALDATKADLDSPTFTGTPILPDTTLWDGMTLTDILTGGGSTGVPAGGTVGYFLRKNSSTDYDTYWSALPSSSGGAGAGGSFYLAKIVEFSGASSVDLGTCFPSTFRTFRLDIEVTGSAATSLRWRLGDWSTFNSGANYHYQQTTSDGTSVTASQASTETSGLLGKTGTTLSYIVADVINPSWGTNTLLNSRSTVASDSTLHMYSAASAHQVAQAYSSMVIFPSSGTITGRVKVYGVAEESEWIPTPSPAPDPVVVFNYGDTMDAITGGWVGTTTGGGGYATIEATRVHLGVPPFNGYGSWATTVDAIDTTGFTRMYAEYATSDRPESTSLYLAAGSLGAYVASHSWSTYSGGVGLTQDGVVHEISWDISSYNGSFWIGLGAGGANYNDTSGDVSFYRVWLQ